MILIFFKNINIYSFNTNICFFRINSRFFRFLFLLSHTIDIKDIRIVIKIFTSKQVKNMIKNGVKMHK